MEPTARELPGHLRLFTNGTVWRMEWDREGRLGLVPYGMIWRGKFYGRSELMFKVLA